MTLMWSTQMPDDKKGKKEEFFIRGDRFIYTKDDLDHIVGLGDKVGPEKPSTILLKKMIPDKKKIN